MSAEQAFDVAFAVLTALGGGGAIVLLLSSWLGRVWAERLMSKERTTHENQLARLQSDLRHQVDTDLATNKNDLEIFKEKHLKGHHDKIAIYRLAADVVVELLGDLDYLYIHQSPPADAKNRIDKLNRERMRAYAYMAMLAPQPVMDALDNLLDHLLLVVNGRETYEWPRVRELALRLLNEIRNDIGVDKSPIVYRGKL